MFSQANIVGPNYGCSKLLTADAHAHDIDAHNDLDADFDLADNADAHVRLCVLAAYMMGDMVLSLF
jgi:hypothetical protein